MEVVPASVGEVSRRWDDEHLDLRSAAETIAGAGTGGFTGTVAGPASRFTAAWERLAGDLGSECETRADGLRTTLRDFLVTDDAAFEDLVELGGYLQERR